MALGATILKKYAPLARRMSSKYSKIWVAAELMLFVLVGAAVDVGSVLNAGWAAICLIAAALIFRMAGVFFCLIRSGLNPREKLFTAIAYLPKATVQAAIGSIPLSLGMSAGNTILTVAVLAILITAPLGALGIDFTHKKLLTRMEKTTA